MSIIALPDNNFRSVQWTLVQPTQVNRSEFTSARQVMQLPGASYWKASADHVPIKGETNIRPWRAFFAKLRGQENTFELQAVESAQHAGSDARVGFASGTSLVNYTNTVVAGATATKTAGSVAYDAAAYSTADLASPVAVSFKASQTNADIFGGLNATPGDGTDYSRLDYSFWLQTNGQYRTAVGGTISGANEGAYTTSTVFTIGYWNDKVYWLVDGRQVRAATVATGQTLGFDSSFLTVGGALNSIRIGQQDVSSTLLVGGMPASTTLVTAGGYLTVPLIDGDAQLVVLTADLASDSGGERGVSIAPMLRKPAAYGATIASILPFCRMAMDSPDLGYSVDPGALYGFAFSAIEAF